MTIFKILNVGALTAILLLPLSVGLAGSAMAQQEGPIDVSVRIPGSASQADEFEVKDAEFRWGLNLEASSGAFEPGTCNFLSAGVAKDSGSSRHWGESEGLYTAESGNTRIEKPDSSGTWGIDSWANRCKDAAGRTVGTSIAEPGTGAQVVIGAGEGFINANKGTAEISWAGSFTLAMYNGRTYWSASDPVLEVANGKGTLRATVSGFGSDMNDTSKWDQLPATKVTLAVLPNVTLGNEGIVTDPAYRQVKVHGVDQVRSGENWGSFPQDFVTFQSTTGQGAYWHSSGGLRDAAKVATTLYISYTPENSVAPSTPPRTLDPDASETSGTGGQTGTVTSPDQNSAPDFDHGTGSSTGSVIGTGGSTGTTPGGGTVTASDPLPMGTVLAAAAAMNAANWLGSSLIPDAVELAKNYRNILLWSLAGVLGLLSIAWVGFRRGWLVLPFTHSTEQHPKPKNK